MGVQAIGIAVDVAHFLDRGNDQGICRISAFQFGNQHAGVLGSLNAFVLFGEVPVFPQRLGAKLDPVHQKQHLVGIPGIGNQLRRLETCHGFAGAGGMPDIAAPSVVTMPIQLGDAIRNSVGRVILVAAHHLQHAVGIIGHRIEADQLVGHGNRKQ